MKVKTLRFDSSKIPDIAVIARNVRLPGGEIDVIARDRDTIVFVEVKARASRRFGSALAAVDAANGARCARSRPIGSRSRPRGARARFDVVTFEDGRPASPSRCLPLSEMEKKLLGGRYRIDALIGRGGMSDVYRGMDVVLQRQVAIKILTDRSEDLRKRFLREAQSMARLNHPNIVGVYDAGAKRRRVLHRHGAGAGPHPGARSRPAS